MPYRWQGNRHLLLDRRQKLHYRWRREEHAGREVFVSPIESTVNGTVYFDLPIDYLGRDIKVACMSFVNGQIMGSDAEEGAETLKELLGVDEGAR